MMIVLSGAAAIAQEKIEIAAAAGCAIPYYGEIDFTAPAIAVSVRFPLLRHISAEPEVAYSRHSEGERSPVTGNNHIVQTRTTWTFVRVTANAIVHGSDRRARAYGGGGPGIYYGDRRYAQSATALYPAVDTREVLSPTVGLQVLGGADGRVNDRLVVFGEFRLEIRSFDARGSAVSRLMGGIRVPIR
jgi:hypothetical protein